MLTFFALWHERKRKKSKRTKTKRLRSLNALIFVNEDRDHFYSLYVHMLLLTSPTSITYRCCALLRFYNLLYSLSVLLIVLSFQSKPSFYVEMSIIFQLQCGVILAHVSSYSIRLPSRFFFKNINIMIEFFLWSFFNSWKLFHVHCNFAAEKKC